MILIGQYDSPFVRRVGIALRIYDIAFEHRTWSAFGDSDKIRQYNPLTRVPTLVLDDGDVIVDSHAMLDYLDGLVGPDRAMFPQVEPARHRAIKIAMLATGLGDKAVSLFYEKRLHDVASAIWIERCRSQISGALEALERDRAGRSGRYWISERIGHADVAVAAVMRFLTEAHPGVVDPAAYPALAAHCRRLEATRIFQEISQPFIPPA